MTTQNEKSKNYKNAASVFFPLGIVFIVLGVTRDALDSVSYIYLLSGVIFLAWSLFCSRVARKSARNEDLEQL